MTISLRSFFRFLLFISPLAMSAQQDQALPFREIPPEPDQFTPSTVVARSIEGLGFRYYWATEALTPTDLDYRPEPSARNSYETLEHIHQLSRAVLNAVLNQPNQRGKTEDPLSLGELRQQTLDNLERASILLRNQPETDLDTLKVIFQSGEKRYEYPFWNLLNGQLADAMYHVGQIVLLRRASGNPMPEGVSVFLGKYRN